jgi:hypothetical protein
LDFAPKDMRDELIDARITFILDFWFNYEGEPIDRDLLPRKWLKERIKNVSEESK